MQTHSLLNHGKNKNTTLVLIVLIVSLLTIGSVAAIAPSITSRGNNITGNSTQVFTMNETDSVNFNITYTNDSAVTRTWYKRFYTVEPNGDVTYSAQTTFGSDSDSADWNTDSWSDGHWEINATINNSDGSASTIWNVTVTDEIQVLLDTLDEAAGGTVTLQAKSYSVSQCTHILFNSNNTHLVGNGSVVYIQDRATLSCDWPSEDEQNGAFMIGGNKTWRANNSISGMNFTGNYTCGSGACGTVVMTRNLDNWDINDSSFTGNWIAITTDGSTNPPDFRNSSNGRIDNNTFVFRSEEHTSELQSH